MSRNKYILYLLIVFSFLIIMLSINRMVRYNDTNKLTNNATSPHYSSVQTIEVIIHLESRTLELIKNGELLKSYSVAVGAQSTPTPTGAFEVINKVKCPGGAYGTRWIGLSAPHIGIHGTDAPETIGKAESEGCIRMKNEDIEDLFNSIKIGTKVTISK